MSWFEVGRNSGAAFKAARAVSWRPLSPASILENDHNDKILFELKAGKAETVPVDNVERSSILFNVFRKIVDQQGALNHSSPPLFSHCMSLTPG